MTYINVVIIIFTLITYDISLMMWFRKTLLIISDGDKFAKIKL